MDINYSELYGNLINVAEIVLNGPASASIATGFWGGRFIALRAAKMPKIEGVIETRIVYANPTDHEQANAILRQVQWDAKAAKQMIFQASRLGRAPSVTYPQLSSHSVWVNMEWVYETLHLLETLSVPFKIPEDHLPVHNLYALRIERTDRTELELSWGAELQDNFLPLTTVWQTIWAQMEHLLTSNEPTDYEDAWGGYGVSPLKAIYKYRDGREKAVSFASSLVHDDTNK